MPDAGGSGSESATREAVLQAEADHWRAMAEEKAAALQQLKRRPAVRAALALDRRLEPLRRGVSIRWQRVRNASRQAAVTVGAGSAVFGRSKRRAALDAQIAQLEPPPTSPKSVLIFDIGGAPSGSASDLVCFVPRDVEPLEDGWIGRLAAEVGDGVVGAAPTLVHAASAGWPSTAHDLLVRSQGFDFAVGSGGEPIAIARGAGGEPRLQGDVTEIPAAPLRGLVVARDAYLAAGGLEFAEDEDLAGIDLCARLRRDGGRIVHVPSAALYDDRPVLSRAAFHRPVDIADKRWHTVVDRHGPALVRTASRNGRVARRWVITTAAPSKKVAARWGDVHLAEGLATALRRLGEDVHVQTYDAADSLAARSRDLHLVLRGVAPVRRTPGQRHVLWVISHPESLEGEECDAADLVLVASSRYADHLRARTSTPVEEFLQATDPERFRPGPVDPAFRHPVTVVAKTRGVMRPIVADALAAGIRPAIYGGGWRGLVDPGLVVADHVDNGLLAAVYRSAGVVLNDHWDTMRAWGFVSNRIFDVLACGTPVISDHLPEIQQLLGDTVATYTTIAELADAVDAVLANPDAARERAQAGRAEVLARHTFDHRARWLLELLEDHDLDTVRPE